MVFIAQIILNPNKIFTSIVLGLVLISQIYELIYYVNKTNRILSGYLDSIKDKDFSSGNNIQIIDSSFKSLNKSLKNISQTIIDSRIEKEIQLNLLNLIIDKVDTGIVLINHENDINLANQAAKNYLNVQKISCINDIKSQSEEFYQLLTNKLHATKKVIGLNQNENSQNLLIYTTPLKLRNENFILVTFNNIKDEMDKKEIQSWQKILRTLSHEIMNSVTPISSLTETSLLQVQTQEGNLKSLSEINNKSLEKIQKALLTIEKRSSGLYNFVSDFRKLAKISKPIKKKIIVKDLLISVQQLMQPELVKHNIEFNVSFAEELSINADITLIEQVLINLIINAKDALANTINPKITLNATVDKGKVCINITDNGVGIATEILDNIFIPFFTTKEKGSGIGLSLSRQIMHLHGGNISVNSMPNKETVFNLIFS